MPIAAILSSDGERAHFTRSALERQTERPGGIESSVEGALTRAAALDDDWVWLLEGGVAPEPDALRALLDASPRFASPPVLLSSRVLAADGSLDPGSTPVPDARRAERVVAALEQGYVAIRVARPGSLLVQARELERLGLTHTGAVVDRELEWTARLLRDGTGLLVPASVAVRQLVAGQLVRRAPVRIASSVRMFAALEPRGRSWFAFHLAGRLAASARRRSADASQQGIP